METEPICIFSVPASTSIRDHESVSDKPQMEGFGRGTTEAVLLIIREVGASRVPTARKVKASLKGQAEK